MTQPNVTIKDIARICGVSITTVSRVVNNNPVGVGKETILRVKEAIKKYQYQPNVIARSMITKKSNTIGLVIPDIRNPFFSELARGVEDVCNRNSYACVLCNTDGIIEKENEYINLLRGRIADGILFPTQNNVEFNPAFLDFQKRKYPFCLIERYVDELQGAPGVYFDNTLGARKITEFIISKGHSKIAFISGPKVTRNSHNRYEGYRQALKSAGIAHDPSLTVEGDYKHSGGYEAVSRLIEKRKRFTAIFAANDLMAFGAYQRLEEDGRRIPEDVSIAGIDNVPFPAVMRPRITTIEIPAYAMGVRATEILFSLITKSRHEVEKYIFQPLLIDKGSVCPPAS